MNENAFAVVGIKEDCSDKEIEKCSARGKIPKVSILILTLIILGCLFANVIMTKDPTYMDLQNYNHAPCSEFLFGTDAMGRDIFSMIWYGGRVSIFIGILSTVISTFIAVVYGAISGLASNPIDVIMMRFTEIILSVPSLLFVVFLQAIMGKSNSVTISIVIGITSWMSIAKVVRTEVRQIRNSEYIVASKCMGGGFFHILRWHLAPNFVSPIMFMVVMNIRGAIVAESTLSFMGIGLPLEVISWGSMLSLSQNALLTGAWWIILVPGVFLVITLVCFTNIGNYLRCELNKTKSNL